MTSVPDLRPTVVVLDLDGTLVDTMDALAALAADVLHRDHDMPVDEATTLYLETSGIPFRDQLDLMLPGHTGLDGTALDFERRKASIVGSSKLSEARIDALHELRRLGFSITVSSSSAHHFVDAFHRRAGFDFDLVLGYRPGQTKGHRHFTMTCEALNATPDQLLFIGDSLMDARLAAGAGVPFIGRVGTFTRDRFSAEHPGVELIDDVVELPDLLQGRIR